ncbi:MAG: hypothetical protein RLY86_966 [Pseudomonadota bacterium]|jgi:iron complex outermembrane receptor protein
MKERLFHHGLTLGAVALVAGTAGQAYAQAQAQAPAAGPVLEEIIVTAQRRAENVQDIPVAVTAVTEAGLARRGITDVSKLDTITPGFSFGRSGSDARPAMRGVRTENVGINGDTTIGYFIDGIYQSRSAQALSSFVDVERIEVQRGPQGTLYGRNTFGGNIAVSTNAPTTKDVDFGGSLTVARFAKVRAEGFVNVPLNDTFAVRFAGARDSSDGWVQNSRLGDDGNLFDDDLSMGRASFLAQTDRLTVVLRAEYAEEGGNGGSAFGYKVLGSYYDPATCSAVFNATPLFLNTRPTNRDGVDDCPNVAGVQDLGVPIAHQDDPFTVDNDYRTFRDSEKRAITADISYELGAVTLRSITGWTDFEVERSSDTDFSGNTIGIDFQRTASETFSQEFQILSDDSGPLTYVAGLYYFEDDLNGLFINQQLTRIIGGVNTGLIGNGFWADDYSDTKSYAAYAQASYRATDDLRLTAGARYTEDEKGFRFVRPAAQNSTIRVDQTPPNLSTTALPERTFDKVTWRLAADYTVAEDSLLYGSVSTGFRSGGFNTRTEVNLFSFEPEKVTAFEVGLKNRFLDNRLQLNLAAFYNEYKDLQEQRQVPTGSTTVSIIFNAAEAEAYGLEAEAEWLVTDEFTLGGTLSLLQAEYTDFRDAPIPGGFANPVGAGGVINPALVPRGLTCGIVTGSANNAYGCDLSGNKIPYSPEWSGSVYTSYAVDLGTAGTVTPLAVLTYSGSFYGQPFNSQLEKTDSYARLDLSVEWADEAGRISVRGFVDNVFDKEIINRTVWGGGGALQASYQPPRTYGVRLTYRH